MYLQHTDASGNELGLFRSIREASKKLSQDVELLSVVVRHKLELSDGTMLRPIRVTNQSTAESRKRIQMALTEYIKIGTHYKFLAHKFNIRQNEMARAINKHEEEKRISSAHLDYLNSGTSVEHLARAYDISPWKLGQRIRKGLKQ